MSKIEKKRKKLIEKIQFLENEMKLNLQKKTSNIPEISLSKYLSQISDLRKQLDELQG